MFPVDRAAREPRCGVCSAVAWSPVSGSTQHSGGHRAARSRARSAQVRQVSGIGIGTVESTVLTRSDCTAGSPSASRASPDEHGPILITPAPYCGTPADAALPALTRSIRGSTWIIGMSNRHEQSTQPVAQPVSPQCRAIPRSNTATTRRAQLATPLPPVSARTLAHSPLPKSMPDKRLAAPLYPVRSVLFIPHGFRKSWSLAHRMGVAGIIHRSMPYGGDIPCRVQS